MARRHHLKTLSATMAVALVAGALPNTAWGRMPWAATSSVHFVETVANADNYRAAAGGLAMKKSPSADVRAFGRALWVDSIADTRRLKWVLAKNDSYVVLPYGITPQYMFVIDELLPVSGDDFDRRFIAQQTSSLKTALALAQDYAQVGDDFDLKEYAERRVPGIRARLAQVLEIERRIVRLVQ
jgi:predicted outer membrane protein